MSRFNWRLHGENGPSDGLLGFSQVRLSEISELLYILWKLTDFPFILQGAIAILSAALPGMQS